MESTMLYIKNIVLQLRQRPIRSLILVLFLAVSAVALILGAYIHATTQGYFDIIAEEAGTGITVWKISDEETVFSDRLLNNLLECSHVTGYNRSYECLCTPISFFNSGYKNDTFYSSEPKNEQILLVGNHNTVFYESFRIGTMHLIDGTFPTEQDPGLLIDQYLAAQNDIAPGDSLLFWNEDENEQVTAVVRGIYQTLQPPKVDNGEYYAISATSYVFCDWEETYRRAASFFDANAPVTIYVDSYRNVSNVIDQFTPLLASYSNESCQYHCEDDYKSNASMESGSGGLLPFRDVINTLMLVLGTIIFLLCVLMIIMWMQDHQQDVGIYKVLGWSQLRIIATLLGEGMLILLSASLSASFIGNIVLLEIGVNMVWFFTRSLGGHAQSIARLNDAMQLAMNGKTIFHAIGMQIIFCLLVMLFSSIYTLHIRCNTLLSGRRAS